jgi:signal transduction histidine kinase
MGQIGSSAGSKEAIVLVVDDTPENLHFIGGVIEPYYRVRVANSGPVALRVAQIQPLPDLILLDILMPEMDGYEVLKRLRAMPETANTPVIFVTAMNSDADEALGLSLGAVDYVTKPVSPALLLARLRVHLELKSARDWLRNRNEVLASEVERQTVEIRAAKEAAENASQAKSDFIDAMSHELRTPMNGVTGMLQLARMELPESGAVREYVDRALASAKSMSGLLDAVLEYTDIAHGDIRLRRQPFSLSECLTNALGKRRGAANDKALALNLALAADIPDIVVGDETRLSRVISILIDNAIKFTTQGRIELGAEASATALHLWVSDTGVGIEPGQVDKIYRPFEPCRVGALRQQPGCGLGLATAARIVQLMRGEIRVETRVGAGSTFHVTMPLN